MASARPLHELFTDLTGEPAATYRDAAPFGEAPGDGAAELLRLHGHADLPDALVAEAMVNYAETASPEVAEHLAPFVMAHTGIVAAEPAQPGDWLDLLATAPAPGADGPDADDPAAGLDVDDLAGTFDPGLSDPDVAADGAAATPEVALDFGRAVNEPAWTAAEDSEDTASEQELTLLPGTAGDWLGDVDPSDIDSSDIDQSGIDKGGAETHADAPGDGDPLDL